MPFTDKPQVFGASINALSFGPAGKEVTIGGSNVYPLYAFDAPLANPVRVGIQVSDKGFDPAIPGLAKFYDGCTTVAEMAARAEEERKKAEMAAKIAAKKAEKAAREAAEKAAAAQADAKPEDGKEVAQ